MQHSLDQMQNRQVNSSFVVVFVFVSLSPFIWSFSSYEFAGTSIINLGCSTISAFTNDKMYTYTDAIQCMLCQSLDTVIFNSGNVHGHKEYY